MNNYRADFISEKENSHEANELSINGILFVGLDVHKQTIAVAVAEPGRCPAIYRSEIRNTKSSVLKMIQGLEKEYKDYHLLFCYEAGPTGYVLYRFLTEKGYECVVVAPSLLPRKPGDRIKTDRRDSMKLATTLRSGDVTPIWVPDNEQEAMRDLTRARDDMKKQEKTAKQQLSSFLLRHGHIWPSGRTRWTAAFYNWVESLKFDKDWQQIVLQEYVDAVKAASQRLNDITAQMMKALEQWNLYPVVKSLIALRGIDKVAAMILLAELGDIRRFTSPKQLMAYLGLVPSEHSSGGSRKQGSITKTGNTHARRILVEAAWCYRFTARKTMHLKRKEQFASQRAREIAWKAQKRLCGRYKDLSQSGKNIKKVCIAVARELSGFVWDIAQQEMPRVTV
jgi:transposase